MGSPRTLLIVEDEAGLLEIATTMLEHAGYRILSAVNGAEAVAMFTENAAEIDGVLLDLRLPDQSGGAVFRSIRDTGSAVPVVLNSGYAEAVALAEFESAGGTGDGLAGYLQKPYPLHDLVRVAGEVFGAP